jgi:hypothetical protein
VSDGCMTKPSYSRQTVSGAPPPAPNRANRKPTDRKPTDRKPTDRKPTDRKLS